MFFSLFSSSPHFNVHTNTGLIVAGALFLLAQFTIYIIWKTVQKRSKKERYLYQHESATAATAVNFGTPSMVYGQAAGSHCGGVTVATHSGPSNASDTLGKLYDSGMTGRYGQQYWGWCWIGGWETLKAFHTFNYA